jgi:hypothetical protein
MEPGEALSAAAQMAVAQAGFAGVVVAFRHGRLEEWPPMDKLRMRLLLSESVIPLISCLMAMLLLTIEPMPRSIWRWCSGLEGLALLFFFESGRRAMSKLEEPIRNLGGYRHVLQGLVLLGWAVILLQFYNAAVPGVFWPFFTAIVYQLALAALQFMRLILLPPQGSA